MISVNLKLVCWRILFKFDTISWCVPSFVVVKLDLRLLIMNRKPGGILKLADGLDLVFTL